MRRLRLALSPAQVSALECRPLRGVVDPDDLVLARAWDGADLLEWDPADTDSLFSCLVEASNAEDAQHQAEGDVLAGRAARSLAALSGRVLRVAKNRRG